MDIIYISVVILYVTYLHTHMHRLHICMSHIYTHGHWAPFAYLYVTYLPRNGSNEGLDPHQNFNCPGSTLQFFQISFENYSLFFWSICICCVIYNKKTYNLLIKQWILIQERFDLQGTFLKKDGGKADDNYAGMINLNFIPKTFAISRILVPILSIFLKNVGYSL